MVGAVKGAVENTLAVDKKKKLPLLLWAQCHRLQVSCAQQFKIPLQAGDDRLRASRAEGSFERARIPKVIGEPGGVLLPLRVRRVRGPKDGVSFAQGPVDTAA